MPTILHVMRKFEIIGNDPIGIVAILSITRGGRDGGKRLGFGPSLPSPGKGGSLITQGHRVTL